MSYFYKQGQQAALTKLGFKDQKLDIVEYHNKHKDRIDKLEAKGPSPYSIYPSSPAYHRTGEGLFFDKLVAIAKPHNVAWDHPDAKHLAADDYIQAHYPKLLNELSDFHEKENKPWDPAVIADALDDAKPLKPRHEQQRRKLGFSDFGHHQAHDTSMHLHNQAHDAAMQAHNTHHATTIHNPTINHLFDNWFGTDKKKSSKKAKGKK